MENNEEFETKLKQEIGKRIDYIRIQNKMSKNKLAKILNISAQHLGKVIDGESGLSIEKIIKLSIETGYSTDYILLGKEITANSNFKNLCIQTREKIEESYKNLIAIESIVR